MTAQASKQDPLATLKHHASEGRMGPAAGRQYCLTMLSELTIITRNIVGFFFRLFLSLSCLLLLLLLLRFFFHILPLAACNVFSDALPQPQAGSADI